MGVIQQIIAVGLTVISLWLVYKNLAQVKFSILFTLASITILTVIGSAFYIIDGIELFGNIVIVLALSLLTYKKDVRKMTLNIFYAIFSMLTLMLIGNITGTILVIIFSTTIPDIRNDVLLLLVPAIIQLIIAFFASLFIGRLFHNKLVGFTETLREKLSIYLMIGSLITWFLYLINVFLPEYISDYAIKDMIYTFVIMAYFIFIIVAMYAFISRMQAEMDLENHEKMMVHLQEYTSSLEIISDDMRRFRHDHINMLLGLVGYIENGDTQGLTKYLMKYIFPSKKNLVFDNASLDKLRNVMIPELKGVLFVKLLQAQELGIDVHIEVYDKITDISIDLIDLCRIVGIALDNAIEAFDETTHNMNFKLQFGVVKKESSMRLVFENTISKPVSLTRVFEKGYSTKSGMRGLGLYSMQQITNKYANINLIVEAKNGLFSLIIEIDNV